MKALKLKNKTFEFEQIAEAIENNGGFCLACSAEVDSGIEPDARNYHCDECGKDQVFGATEILIMGYVS